jgi:hypothetical protein
MPKNRPRNAEDAQVIALKVLAFLAREEGRFGRFLNVTGLSIEAIRSQAAAPAFLAGVLDHLRSDQTLLFLFAEADGISPEQIDQARRALPGAGNDF